MHVYTPVDGAGREVGKCGWSNISAVLFTQPGVEITAGFQSGSGLGLYALGAKVQAGIKVEFTSPQLRITSPELQAVLTPRFGTYQRGTFNDARAIQGPDVVRLGVLPFESPRPDQITVALPTLLINGKSIDPAPVALRLRTSAGLVGLCQ